MLGIAPAVRAAAAALPADVDRALAQAKVPREALAAVVLDLQDGVKPALGNAATAITPRLAWQPQQPVNPASLMKLMTTYAALDLLGPAWVWTTPVWLQGSIREGVLDGDVVIKGSGDPKFVIERLWLTLRRVQQAGVREIHGDIVLDRSAFAAGEQAPGDFDGEPLRPSNAQADALLLNYRSMLLTFTPEPENAQAKISSDVPLAGVRIDPVVGLSDAGCGDWRSTLKLDFHDPTRLHFNGSYPTACGEQQWPLAYADPKSFNARAIEGLWAELGGRITGHVRDGLAPTDAPSFSVSSPALAELIRDVNKYSNNVMAQQLFLTLGLVQRGSGTPDAARDVLRQWLVERVGDAAKRVVIDNGSGLSRDTRITALALALLLQQAWASPVMPELMSSLPISGLDGTLRRSQAPLGRAHLKTGSLRDVVGIAGYVLTDSGRRRVVVAIVNHANANAARPALDALVQWVEHDQRAPE